jgi:hypothetical protein
MSGWYDEKIKELKRKIEKLLITWNIINNDQEILFLLSKKPTDDDLIPLIKTFDFHTKRIKSYNGILCKQDNDFKIIIKNTNELYNYRILNIYTNEYYF